MTSMGTLKAFMNSTALRCPSRDRLKQPRRSLASESAPAQQHIQLSIHTLLAPV